VSNAIGSPTEIVSTPSCHEGRVNLLNESMDEASSNNTMNQTSINSNYLNPDTTNTFLAQEVPKSLLLPERSCSPAVDTAP
jgi:hypothetical protein